VTTADGRTFSGAALVAADGVRSLFRAKLIGDGEPRQIGYVGAAHHRADERSQGRRAARLRGAVERAGPAYRALSACGNGSEFNVVNVFRTAAHAERLDDAAARAELNHAYRDTHPSMRALIGMMDLRWRRSIRRPRSGAALAPRPHRAARRRRACATAIAGARRRHGDRRRPLPRRGDPRRGRRLSGRIPPLRGGAALAHRAGAAGSRSLWDFITSTKASPATCAMPPWPIGTRRICSDCLAWLYDGSAFSAL